MFKRLWQKWTIDKPAAFGDLLWEIFVVQLAALLDRLTLRRIIALIPVVILALAYAHRLPLPPELMLVGDLLAYIDVFAVILLFSILGRLSTIWLFAMQAAEQAFRLADRVRLCVQRFDLRRQRERGARGRRRLTDRTRRDEEEPGLAGLALA